jgi:Ca2+-binding RTX toxin-like protein
MNIRAVVAVFAAATLTVLGTTLASAQSARPRCFGQPATIVGTPGNDTLEGGDGRDVIAGLGGNDNISGGDGADLICGQRGNDELLYGGDGGDRVSGGRGNDVVAGEFPESDDFGEDVLFGNAGHDGLIGGSRNDTLWGGAGDDTLEGDYGNDAMTGGPGSDTVVFPWECGTADLRAGTASGPEGPADTLRDVENLEGPDFNNFSPTPCTFFGNAEANDLVGGVHNDLLRGGGGADSLDGRAAGSDQLFGDLGPDSLDAADGEPDDRADGGAGRDACAADAGDVVVRCE